MNTTPKLLGSLSSLVLIAGAFLLALTLPQPDGTGAQLAQETAVTPGQTPVVQPTVAPSPVAPPAAAPSPVYESPEEAEARDLAKIAADQGWTVEQATANRRAGEARSRVVVQILKERPDIFVGSTLSADPRGAPSIYIKGPTDEFVRSLVAGSEILINIVDNQPFSFEELRIRANEVHDALRAQGFRVHLPGSAPPTEDKSRQGSRCKMGCRLTRPRL